MLAEQGKVLLHMITDHMPELSGWIEENTLYPSEADYETEQEYYDAVHRSELIALHGFLHDQIGLVWRKKDE